MRNGPPKLGQLFDDGDARPAAADRQDPPGSRCCSRTCGVIPASPNACPPRKGHAPPRRIPRRPRARDDGARRTDFPYGRRRHDGRLRASAIRRETVRGKAPRRPRHVAAISARSRDAGAKRCRSRPASASACTWGRWRSVRSARRARAYHPGGRYRECCGTALRPCSSRGLLLSCSVATALDAERV